MNLAADRAAPAILFRSPIRHALTLPVFAVLVIAFAIAVNYFSFRHKSMVRLSDNGLSKHETPSSNFNVLRYLSNSLSVLP